MKVLSSNALERLVFTFKPFLQPAYHHSLVFRINQYLQYMLTPFSDDEVAYFFFYFYFFLFSYLKVIELDVTPAARKQIMSELQVLYKVSKLFWKSCVVM